MNYLWAGMEVNIFVASPDNGTIVLCVPRARHDQIRDLLFKYFTPKLGIGQKTKLPGKIRI